MTGSAKALLGNVLLTGSVQSKSRGRAAGTYAMATAGNGFSPVRTVGVQTAHARYVSAGAFSDAITVTITY
jgi:spore coat protein U-like protein